MARFCFFLYSSTGFVHPLFHCVSFYFFSVYKHIIYVMLSLCLMKNTRLQKHITSSPQKCIYINRLFSMVDRNQKGKIFQNESSVQSVVIIHTSSVCKVTIRWTCRHHHRACSGASVQSCLLTKHPLYEC